MKIAISASGKDLESLIDPLFGRCPYFIIVDPEDIDFETFENPNLDVEDDAGIKSARFIVSKGAEVVITGNCGPRAFQELSDAGIEIIIGLMGTIRQAIEIYKKGNLLTTSISNVEEYFGKHHQQSTRREGKDSRDDDANAPNNAPWFGYIRLDQKKSTTSE